MGQPTQTPTVEQTLNKTDFGHTIYEYRKPLFALIIAILLGGIAYGVWTQVKHGNAIETAEKVFSFQSGTWADVQSGKQTVPELVKAFEGLDKDVQTAPVMLPVVIEMSKFLFDKGNYAEAEAILSKVSGSYNHPVSAFFVGMQRAAVLEKLGKADEAISVLEPLAQSKEGLMPAKVSVQLGRLYMDKGEKGKAQTQFEYVINNFPNDGEAKVAKLYLAQLAQ